MLPARRPDTAEFTARQAQREIVLWTTKDGREIPLEEMTDSHIENAVRVLSKWRAQVRKRDKDNPVIRDLADAIARFKRIMSRRRKTVSGKALRSIAGPRRP